LNFPEGIWNLLKPANPLQVNFRRLQGQGVLVDPELLEAAYDL